jgi:hypothetical protein
VPAPRGRALIYNSNAVGAPREARGAFRISARENEGLPTGFTFDSPDASAAGREPDVR